MARNRIEASSGPFGSLDQEVPKIAEVPAVALSNSWNMHCRGPFRLQVQRFVAAGAEF